MNWVKKTNYNMHQHYITVSVFNLINVKNMTHLVCLFIQIQKEKNSMEEKDSKRADILVPLLIDEKKFVI